MKSASGTEPKPALTAAEVRILEHVTAHMDEWIDQICERVDQLLQNHSLEACGETQDPLSDQKNPRRAA